jgi:hypothetical protein
MFLKGTCRSWLERGLEVRAIFFGRDESSFLTVLERQEFAINRGDMKKGGGVTSFLLLGLSAWAVKAPPAEAKGHRAHTGYLVVIRHRFPRIFFSLCSPWLYRG